MHEAVREKVRENIIENGWVDEDIRQDLTDAFSEELKINGLSNLINDMRWSLSHCQGDGVAFYGQVNLVEFLDAENRWEYWPELEAYKELISSLCVNVVPNNNHYNHYNSMCIESDFYSRSDVPKFLIEALRSLVDSVHDTLRSISRICETKGYKIIRNIESESYIKELLEINEIEFLQDGHIIGVNVPC